MLVVYLIKTGSTGSLDVKTQGVLYLKGIEDAKELRSIHKELWTSIVMLYPWDINKHCYAIPMGHKDKESKIVHFLYLISRLLGCSRSCYTRNGYILVQGGYNSIE